MIFYLIIRMTMISILVIFLASLITYYIFSKRNSKYMKNVPGPKPNILFGNTLDFLVLPSYGWLGCLVNYLDTYGSTVIVHDGPISCGLVTRDVKLVEHILSSTTIIYKHGPYQYLHSWLGSGLLTSAGVKWKKRRRMLTPSFHFSILDNFIDVFDRYNDIFIKKLEKEIGKKSVNISPLVSLMTLDIIGEAAMGIKINAQDEIVSEYVKKVKVMCAILPERMISPLHPLFYPFTLNHFREKRALKVLHAHTDKIIENRINEGNNNKDVNINCDSTGQKKRLAFLDLLLKSTIDGEPLSRLDIREEVDTFMFEGHDTTSSAISFAMYAIASHPEIQEKLFLEQTKIFEDLKDAKPSVPQLHEMKYLELVIKETLRLYPSVPFYGRTLAEDLEWDGILYPKGLNIMIFTFAIHRCSKYFPDPLKFIPERFEGTTNRNPYVYIPFSAGPRNCIGQKFAMLELKSTLSKVIRNFKLLPAVPAHTLQLSPDTILVSKNGVCISLKKRLL